jgi:hypothetical protein
VNPKDERHGTHAGYIAGCREECCRTARRRAQKLRLLHRLTTGQGCLVPHDTFRAVVDPWLRLGLSPYAIETATGVGSRIADILRDRSDVLRTTFDAVVRLTEDDLPGSAKVFTDLTRTRIESLMAAGHRLSEMPINSRGQWRSREHVAVETARAIRDYYAAHEFHIGPDRHTAARARNRGARPPLAWDDPGTLAWPKGRPERAQGGSTRPRKTDVDLVVVERVLAGDRLPTTKAERYEVIRRWPGTDSELERRTGWNVARYLREMRAAEGTNTGRVA